MDLLETAKHAARTGGQIILKYYTKVDFRQKADSSYVSIADDESEAAIKKIILEKFPDHSINGEETGVTGQSNIVWHVDPLDGTINFKSGIPYSAVSIGVEKDGEFIVGVIYNPFADQLFFAKKGKGAFVHEHGIERKIQVNKLSIGEGVNIIDASFRDDRAKRKQEYLAQLLTVASKLRMIGSTALALTEMAAGNCVTVLCDAIHSYDFAAGVVLVTEAGGIITDQYGNAPKANSTAIIASNKENYHTILRFAKVYNGYAGM